MSKDTSNHPARVQGELEIFELSRAELPTHVRRIRAHHAQAETAPHIEANTHPLVERSIDELNIRIG